MTTPENSKVWVRHTSLENALASAKRLAKKYGSQFAIVFDEMDMPGFFSPYAIVSHKEVFSS